jgi:hypothetical protein
VCRLLSAGALAVRAPWPTAGPTLAFLQLLLGPANAAFSSHLLLGILHPADELVTGQRRDVLPGNECRGVRDQRLAQVSWKLVYHPTGHSRAAHRATVAGQCEPSRHSSGRGESLKAPTRPVPSDGGWSGEIRDRPHPLRSVGSRRIRCPRDLGRPASGLRRKRHQPEKPRETSPGRRRCRSQ